MRTLQSGTSACRYCGCYIPEGRRGGYCEQLSVPVQGEWKPCPLAIPAFAPSWESFLKSDLWEGKVLTLPTPRLKDIRPSYLPIAELSEIRYSSDDVA